MLPTFREAKPDKSEPDRFPMTTEYVEVYARKDNMSSVILENDGGIDIRFHYKKGNPKGGKYRTLHAGDFRSIATDAEFIYAAAIVAIVPPPELVVTVNSFSNKRIREIETEQSTEDLRGAVEQMVQSLMQTEVRTRLMTELSGVFQAIRETILRRR